MSQCTVIVLLSYLLAERRVIPICISDKKNKQTINVQAGRVFTRFIENIYNPLEGHLRHKRNYKNK